MDKSKIILHLDMNSYFASVEQQANPHLRGQPVGVCEHLGGIIIAPSVEAKRLGIKLGTPVWEALKICPKIELLPTDPDKYREITDKFMNILYDYTEDVERYSIDEAFVDLTDWGPNFEDIKIIALEIKQRLRREVGEWISCSIGIGPNKLVSKIAADLGEGDIDRIFIVKPTELEGLYERLKLTDVPGIGPRLERSLNKLGIFTLQELSDYPVSNLINYYGVNGYFLHELANFHDGSGLVRESEEAVKSVGHMYTTPRPLTTLQEIKMLMLKLAEKVGRRMRKYGAYGCIVHYFHSDKKYQGFHRQHRLSEFINDGRDIYLSALRIYQEGRAKAAYPIKIMGISISGLRFQYSQESLFEEYRKLRRVVQALDRINNRYGEYTIHRGEMLGAISEWAKDTVGFGRARHQKS